MRHSSVEDRRLIESLSGEFFRALTNEETAAFYRVKMDRLVSIENRFGAKIVQFKDRRRRGEINRWIQESIDAIRNED